MRERTVITWVKPLTKCKNLKKEKLKKHFLNTIEENCVAFEGKLCSQVPFHALCTYEMCVYRAYTKGRQINKSRQYEKPKSKSFATSQSHSVQAFVGLKHSGQGRSVGGEGERGRERQQWSACRNNIRSKFCGPHRGLLNRSSHSMLLKYAERESGVE